MDININKDESIDDLDLKGLKLIQKEKAFRFGIDAVLLSDFANVYSCSSNLFTFSYWSIVM